MSSFWPGSCGVGSTPSWQEYTNQTILSVSFIICCQSVLYNWTIIKFGSLSVAILLDCTLYIFVHDMCTSTSSNRTYMSLHSMNIKINSLAVISTVKVLLVLVVLQSFNTTNKCNLLWNWTWLWWLYQMWLFWWPTPVVWYRWDRKWWMNWWYF